MKAIRQITRQVHLRNLVPSCKASNLIINISFQEMKCYTFLNTHKKKSANLYLGYIKVALYGTSLTDMGNYNTWMHQGW